MKILQEMVEILTKYKTKQIEVIGNPTDNKSQVYEFYDLIANGTLSTDEAAAAHFFDGNVRKQSYKNLKTRLKNRLINTVFFIEANYSMYNEYERAHTNCYKDWAAAKILASKSATNSAINLGTKILKQALKADFLDIIIEVSVFLRTQYGIIRPDKKKFDYYNNLIKKYLLLREKEIYMGEYYLLLIRYFIENKPSDSELIRKATKYYELIKEDFEEYNSFKILLYGGMIQVIKHMGMNDYEETVKICQSVINRFEEKPMIWPGGICAFYLQKIVCHIQLKEYEEGKKTIEKLLQYLEEGTFNWFKGRELYVYLLFHTKNYNEIYNLYTKTIQNKTKILKNGSYTNKKSGVAQN